METVKAPRPRSVQGDFGSRFEQALAGALAELKEFVETPQFQRVLAEMEELSFEERDLFVRKYLLVPEELERLGITPPESIVIQRSRFGDDRPHVFAVVKYLPSDYRKVTIIYNYSDEKCWVTRPDLLVRETVG